MSVDDEAVRPIDPSGVPHLDMVLGGGIQRGALVMVVGPPGSGKTTLAAQMACAAARAGRRTLIVTAYSEPPVKFVDHMRSFTFFADDLLGGLLQVQSVQQFLPQGLAATADEIRAEVRRTRTSLLVLDGFRGMRGGDPQAARQFLYEMGTALGLMATTTIITSEAPPRDVSLFPEVTTADVLLGLHDQLEGVRQRRSIEVVKARGMAPLSGLHSLIPTSDGLVVAPRLEARAVAASFPVAGTAERASSERAAFSLPELDMLLGGGG